MGQTEVRKLKSKLLSSTLANSAIIHMKTPHINVITSYTEGLHLSKLIPMSVLPNWEMVSYKCVYLKKSTSLGSKRQGRLVKTGSRKKEKNLSRTSWRNHDSLFHYCNCERAVIYSAEIWRKEFSFVLTESQHDSEGIRGQSEMIEWKKTDKWQERFQAYPHRFRLSDNDCSAVKQRECRKRGKTAIGTRAT